MTLKHHHYFEDYWQENSTVPLLRKLATVSFLIKDAPSNSKSLPVHVCCVEKHPGKSIFNDILFTVHISITGSLLHSP